MSIENFESIIAKSLSIYNELTSPSPFSLPKSSSTEENLLRILEIIDTKMESIEETIKTGGGESGLSAFSNDIDMKREISFYIPKNNYKLLSYFQRIMLYSPIEYSEYIVNGLRVNINYMEHTLTFIREADKVKTDVLTLIDDPKGFHVCIQMYKQQQPLDNNEAPQPVNHYTSDVKSLFPSILDQHQISKKNNDKE